MAGTFKLTSSWSNADAGIIYFKYDMENANELYTLIQNGDIMID